ncbi:PLP-dependent aminotransferase family protein [Kitasatospora sp. NPDC006697]|uniref:MocR-like pyridoxine biosynthesis transcription factor PdxR n=1 Tax=Kitasatospora sp. NPDC006697 TaxID=3364020 RepID=UPI0036BDFFD4
MDDSWVNSGQRIGADLHLELGRDGSRRAALITALREAVRDGRLAPGSRLPPYRSLAADLGLARNTVSQAYAELVAEGWLTARQGSGTRVAERVDPPSAVRTARPATRRTAPHLLLSGQPDASAFPRAAWLAAARRAVQAAPAEAFGPGDPRGRIELRRAVAEYLARARGVRTDPERIVVCAGFAAGMRLLYPGGGGGVLRGALAVEEYGLPFHRQLLAAVGVPTRVLTVDQHGAAVGELVGMEDAGAVLLTPAHQFPTGGPLHPERRLAAVDWARARDAVVLEDDYDGDFRYDRQPVGAVQGLDPERVVYLGSVSKSLSPALRIGWLVLPDHLVDPVLAAKGEREGFTGVVDQLTLAAFLESGDYDRHLRRMRQRYRERRDELVAALAERAPQVTVTGIAAGLHAVLRLPAGTEPATLRAARWHGVALFGLASFRHPEAVGPTPDGLVVGYAAPPDHGWRAALAALCEVLPEAD